MFRQLAQSFVALLLCGSSIQVLAQEAPPTAPAQEASQQQAQFDEFAKKMSNAVLQGHFVIDGQTSDLKQERYELKSVSKLPQGDLWLFQARIKYGDHDVTVPLPLPVKWADQTPIITLDEFTIPGLGTFSARVLIDGKRYAGTWQHGEVGGLLFGQIVPAEATP